MQLWLMAQQPPLLPYNSPKGKSPSPSGSGTGATSAKGSSSPKSKKAQTNLKTDKGKKKVASQKRKKQITSSDWHLKKGEIAKNAAKTQVAFHMHIRVLWGFTNQKQAPSVVTEDDRKYFRKQFKSQV
ncbi:hypothetical protein DXG03_009499 [Asterophora parasitica]|uniref:Uncharacterized protein n=1 Tax=Asterophora parasitica TaxID=117018 RepID=A0A9P7K6L3_9AGAR|nr:hypothetical protein DXG03_009499 [Asterophora parasitica]